MGPLRAASRAAVSRGGAFAGSEFKPFDPETVWTFETGIKGRDSGNRSPTRPRISPTTTMTCSERLRPGPGDRAIRQPVYQRRIRENSRLGGCGFLPGPTTVLSIDASVGYLNAEYEEFETLVNGVLTDVSTRRLPNAPEWTGFLGVTYSGSAHPRHRRYISCRCRVQGRSRQRIVRFSKSRRCSSDVLERIRFDCRK